MGKKSGSKKKRQREAMASAQSPNGVESDVSSPSGPSASKTHQHPNEPQSKPSTPTKQVSATFTPAQATNDDPSTWSKSKRKRMKLKAKKQAAADKTAAAKKLLIASEKDGAANNKGNIKQSTSGNGEKNAVSPTKTSTSSSSGNASDVGASPIKKRQRKNSDVEKSPVKDTSKQVSSAGGDEHISPKKKKKKKAEKPNTPTSTPDRQDTNKSSPTKNVSTTTEASTPTSAEGTSPKKKKKKKKKKSLNADSTPPPTTLEEAVKSTLKSPKQNEKVTKKKTKNGNTKSDSKGDGSTTSKSSNTKQQPTSPKLKISLPKQSQMSTLQKAFLERLTSSRFRELNEELYTHSSAHSFENFTQHPELFDQYHVGFRKQVKEWPVNPVDVIYKKIVSGWRKDRVVAGKDDKKKGNKKNNEQIVIADFGCGDAKLAERLLALEVGSDGQTLTQAASSKKKKKSKDQPQSPSPKCPFKVHSFDLVSGGNPLVTPADMSNVPLPDESVDIGVYSLALMGTNVADFVREAWRVLKFGGTLRVAEVRSRFETASAEVPSNKGQHGGGKRLKSNNGKKHNQLKKNQHSIANNNDGGGDDMMSPQPIMLLEEFIALMERCGFECKNMDRSNKMFLFMDFLKKEGSSGLSDKERFTAKPCIYKRR